MGGGDDNIRVNFFSRTEPAAIGPAVPYKHLVDSRRGANLRAKMARRIGNYPAYRSHSAASKTPGAKSAIQLSHVVMQEDIGGAGRPRPHEGADDAASGHGSFENLGFKPFIQEIRRTHGHEFCHVIEEFLAELAKMIAQRSKSQEFFRIPGG